MNSRRLSSTIQCMLHGARKLPVNAELDAELCRFHPRHRREKQNKRHVLHGPSFCAIFMRANRSTDSAVASYSSFPALPPCSRPLSIQQCASHSASPFVAHPSSFFSLHLCKATAEIHISRLRPSRSAFFVFAVH